MCTGPEATLPLPPQQTAPHPAPPFTLVQHPPAPGLSSASPRAQDHVRPYFPKAVPSASQTGGHLGFSLQLWSPCLSRGTPAPTSGRTHSPVLGLGTVHGHRGQDRDGKCPSDLGAVHGERQCAVLEGILGWAMAQGGEGQHISSHLTRMISTAITQGAERRGKSPRAPQGRWR